MNQDRSLLSVAQALQDPAAVAFVRAAVKAGYAEFFPETLGPVTAMVDDAFERLAHSQQAGPDAEALREATLAALTQVFRKGDPEFWFNQVYHHYKTQIKPEADYQHLRGLISGTRVLDYGCGSGYLAARLARGGYQVVTTDVLDYRYAEAKFLPFVKMTSPTDIAYPDGGIDTALVQAVLHHIDPDDLAAVIQSLARVAAHVIIKEDTCNLPRDLPDLDAALARQSLLRAFVALASASQFQALILIDFFANAIAQGVPEMNMPFEFKPVPEWRRVLGANGLTVRAVQVAGFEPGRMHKSCHVWLVCDSRR